MADEILIRLQRDQIPQFDAAHEQLGLVYAGHEVVVLRRQPLRYDHANSGRDYLRLFGSPRAIWAGDLFHALNLNHASGLLVFSEGSIRKDVWMKNGEIVFAQSNQNDDRLGESLIRAGRITQAQLDEAALAITPENKLGKILVDKGWISPKELFLGVRRQVEEIVWSLFDWPARYVFYEGFADPESVIALNLETHKLIVEGIRRSRLWAAVPVTAPERQITVRLASNPKNMGLNQEERRLVALVAHGPTLAEVVDQSGMGVLETYKIVHHLLEREIVAVAHATPQSEPRTAKAKAVQSELEKTVYNFQAIFQNIIALLKKRVGDVDVIARLNSFFEVLPEDLGSVFGTVRFSADGELDIARIVANAAQAGKSSRTLVLRAFNELLYFTLFEMKNFLSDEDTDHIMEIIENMEIF